MSTKQKESTTGSTSEQIASGIIMLVILSILMFGMFMLLSRSVDSGENCVVTKFGRAVRVESAGRHWRIPLVNKYNCFSLRDKVYEAGSNPDASGADYPDFLVDTQTSDGQSIKIAFSIAAHIEKENAITIYTSKAKNTDESFERVVKLLSRGWIRTLAKNYTAEELYTGESIEIFQKEAAATLNTLLADNYMTMGQFVIREVVFEEKYLDSIEDKEIARQRIQTEANNAMAAQNTALTTAALAKGEAQAEIERANGYAEARTIRASADASAIEMVGKSLDAHPLILQQDFIDELSEANVVFLPSDGLSLFYPMADVMPTEPAATYR